MKLVKLSAIRIDGGTQCRIVIDQPTVYNYLEAMKDGAEFPLIETVFDGSTHWLIDGFHRYHAFKLMGVKDVTIKYKPGTLQDAQIAALGANPSHGLPLSNKDKHNKVEMALQIEGFAEKSDYEIAKICNLSKSFVGAHRRLDVKKKQQENIAKHYASKAKIDAEDSSSTTNQKVSNSFEPDDEEMRASEMAQQKDIEAMYKLLESDDALSEAHDEIKRLNHMVSTLEVRVNGLMNEKNEAIKMVKSLQKQLDGFKKKATK